MNLTTLKASAEQAKTSPAELEIWQMEISPDEVLRLVEVARAAKEAQIAREAEASANLTADNAMNNFSNPQAEIDAAGRAMIAASLADKRLRQAFEGIEP